MYDDEIHEDEEGDDQDWRRENLLFWSILDF